MGDKAILALDIGSNAAAAFSPFGDPSIPEVAFIATKGNRAEKLSLLRSWLADRIIEWAPDAIIFERPFARGQAATRMLWGMAGVIEGISAELEIPVVDIPPSTIKKFAVGKGTATKDEMTEAAKVRFGYRGDNEHEADAVCLLNYGHAHIRFESEDRDGRKNNRRGTGADTAPSRGTRKRRSSSPGDRPQP